MAKKILRKKYESLGYTIIPGDNFETSLLLEFIRKHKYLDNYSKVKLGEYKPNAGVEEYNKQVIGVLDFQRIQKLLFICKICSLIGDPGFPDFLVYKRREGRLPSNFRVQNSEEALRYVYSEDGLSVEKSVFIAFAKLLNVINVKLAAVDFSDFSNPDIAKIDLLEVLEKAFSVLSKRVNVQNSLRDIGIDLTVFKKWLVDKQVNRVDIEKMYQDFVEAVSVSTKLKELIKKLELMDINSLLGKKDRPEKLKSLREALGINMLEAVDVLNLWEITQTKPF
ncbi:MAG: hypothetical protein HY512_03205 [Candidatus Aenigmarchaeota archaeon]|nr:hypothetical protein [Candidatus Aenigmarchaeota archaeon]